MTVLCVLHTKDDPAEPWIGLLCKRHRNEMDDLTREIGELLTDTCRIVDGGAPALNVAKTRRLKQPEGEAPGDLALMAVLDSRTKIGTVRATTLAEPDTSQPVVPVLAVVASWLLLVAQERPLTGRLPQSVLAQLALLAKHHDWLAGTLYVDDYLIELRDVRHQLRNVLNDRTHFRVATCDLPTDDGQIAVCVVIRRNRAVRVLLMCGGDVLVRNGEDVWRCVRCEATWLTDQQKARFGVRASV